MKREATSSGLEARSSVEDREARQTQRQRTEREKKKQRKHTPQGRERETKRETEKRRERERERERERTEMEVFKFWLLVVLLRLSRIHHSIILAGSSTLCVRRSAPAQAGGRCPPDPPRLRRAFLAAARGLFAAGLPLRLAALVTNPPPLSLPARCARSKTD